MISDVLREAIGTIREWYIDDPEAPAIVATLDELRAWRERQPTVPCASLEAFLSAPSSVHLPWLDSAGTVREALAVANAEFNAKARVALAEREAKEAPTADDVTTALDELASIMRPPRAKRQPKRAK